MAARQSYKEQVSLLVRILPFVADEQCFALKGGTAINLFFRDLPRLSVDIDLTYLPINDRKASLEGISSALVRIGERLKTDLPGSHIHKSYLAGENVVTKLIVQTGQAQVKVEVSPVLRGCLYDPSKRRVSKAVENEFGFVEIQTVSFADLYAGKIVAALDRQHPRDLFDVRDLLANEGINEDLRVAFIVYLLSHNRPMAEVLAPHRKDIALEFERGFAGMTSEPVEPTELTDALENLIVEVVGKMPTAHKEFLISFNAREPNWGLMDMPVIKNLPAVKWRMANLAKLNAAQSKKYAAELSQVLNLS